VQTGFEMSYKIYAEIVDPVTGKQERGTGTLTDHEDTKSKALRGARQLREQGFTVTITDGDGKAVEEANSAPGP
jgi:hypothetical protein